MWAGCGWEWVGDGLELEIEIQGGRMELGNGWFCLVFFFFFFFPRGGSCFWGEYWGFKSMVVDRNYRGKGAVDFVVEFQDEGLFF